MARPAVRRMAGQCTHGDLHSAGGSGAHRLKRVCLRFARAFAPLHRCQRGTACPSNLLPPLFRFTT
ncbi:hypothetical protein CFB40_02315 [Burkholderia sp. AU31652]|nr:hypothetical protein CFB40_02315 [Burkholderia sp. AU31652]